MGLVRAAAVTIAVSSISAEAAHGTANAFFGPSGGSDELFAVGGGGAMTALALAALASIGAALVAGFTARRKVTPRLMPFAVVCPAVFTLLETTESLAGGHVGLTTYATSTFVFGLALQVPAALVAYLLVRAILAIADAVARSIRGSTHVARTRTVNASRSRSARCSRVAARSRNRAPPPLPAI